MSESGYSPEANERKVQKDNLAEWGKTIIKPPKVGPNEEASTPHNMDSKAFWEKMVSQSLRNSERPQEERLAVADAHAEAIDQSKRDALTGLPNREAFNEALRKKLESLEDETEAYLLLSDFDGFKPVNDTYGHPTGDEVLKLMANLNDRLPVRREEPVYRLGGDEFAQIVDAQEDEVGLITQRENLAMEDMSQILLEKASDEENRPIKVRLSFGVVKLEKGMTPDEAYKEADLALIKVKEMEKGTALLAENVNGERTFRRPAVSIETKGQEAA